MELTRQVSSLELSRRLQELGVKQESLYFHRGVSNNTDPSPEKWYYSWGIVLSNETVPEYFNNARLKKYSAFTSAELGEMLPVRIDAKSKKDGRKIIAYYIEYHVSGLSVQYVHHLDTRQVLWEEAEETEADARAKMLIYLLENNLLANE